MRKDTLPDLLHLCHVLGANSRVLRHLLEHFDHRPDRIRLARPSELRAIGLQAASIDRIAANRQSVVRRDLNWAQQPANHLIDYRDQRYPALLRELPDYPVLLYARGDPQLLQAPQIAIVGSRRCTPGGTRSAQEFAAEFAAAGLVVTSGLALGIDAASHRGALEAGGKTLAVLGSGIDVVYPPRNRELFENIAAQGLIVSEFAPGTEARAAAFPQRNRIISGLALATLVVEAAARSGSLITARLAAEQGREVFALPGSIHNPLTRGCHRLIRDGARLIETPGEVTRELSVLFDYVFAARSCPQTAVAADLDPRQLRLLQVIGYDPVGFDELAERSGLTIAEVSSMLVLLELKDLVQTAPGGCFVRI